MGIRLDCFAKFREREEGGKGGGEGGGEVYILNLGLGIWDLGLG